jgi:hypothetical protein
MKRCFSGLLKVFLIIKTTPTRIYCSKFTLFNRGICFNYYLLLYRGVDKPVALFTEVLWMEMGTREMGMRRRIGIREIESRGGSH